MLGYGDDRVVLIAAQRVAGNIRPAYKLSVTWDGKERREFGPAFEEVFQCEPGFERPSDE